MGKVYKTAMGKNVDIDSLRLTNEDAIAVGNMKTNARGDQLGPGGKVIQGRNPHMDQYYKIHSPMASDNAEQVAQQQAAAGASAGQGQAMESMPNVDPDGVPFEEAVAPLAPQLRGSFADSIAREVTVTQDLLTPPNKSKGPSRI